MLQPGVSCPRMRLQHPAAPGRKASQRPEERSAAADEFAAAYQSECEPEGLYGALKIVPGGPSGAL